MEGSLDREASVRWADRRRVVAARRQGRKAVLLWLLVGPGVLAMLAENDGPSMLSYAASGALYGVGFILPFVVVTFAMAYVVQEITVRLAAASGMGHAELIYRRFGPFWGHFAMADLVVTNLFTLVSEFGAVVAGASFFGVPPWAGVAAGVAVAALAPVAGQYWRWERTAMALAALGLGFVPVALLAHPNWGAVATALTTGRPWPRTLRPSLVMLLLSDVGATITPWMLFFQQATAADKGLAAPDVAFGRLDTALGAALAALAAIACMVAASPLHRAGLSAASFGAARFAQALRPYVGPLGSALFALGVLQAGLVATATISTSSAYAFAEVTRQAHSLNRSLREAPAFHLVAVAAAGLAGGALLLPHVPLEEVALTVNVLAVLTMPPALVFLLLLANDPEVMGPLRNTGLLNALGAGVAAFVVAAGLAYAVSLSLPLGWGGGA